MICLSFKFYKFLSIYGKSFQGRSKRKKAVKLCEVNCCLYSLSGCDYGELGYMRGRTQTEWMPTRSVRFTRKRPKYAERNAGDFRCCNNNSMSNFSSMQYVNKECLIGFASNYTKATALNKTVNKMQDQCTLSRTREAFSHQKFLNF